ncbi:MAG: AmpG family muropeptide MFS transporter [Betaproteobacteria bacterium]|nr:AmpG family muropeptide MFS transporter [Betaproteobacteria bacterium]
MRDPRLGHAILNRRMLICIFTGFSSGLPLFILINLLPAWLRSSHVDLKAIGLFALIQLPYTWKFAWAPFMDRFTWANFGRRRGWMLFSQLALLGCVPLFGWLTPGTEIWTVAAVALCLAFLSASQDVALDAFRREILSDAELGLGTAIHVNAYKVAGLVPGSLALILADHLPWKDVFTITGAFMLPGIAMTLLVKEPAIRRGAPRTLREAVIEPFREFIVRQGWREALIILAFIFLYKLGDSMATALATPFYLDLGFSKSTIGLIAKQAGLWPSVIGGLLGGIWMVRLGINRALWLFGAVQLAAILGFAWLAKAGHNEVVLAWVIGLEALGVGLGTAAFTAYIARTTHPLYTATQFALFTSLSAVPRSLFNALTGYLVDALGWFSFFLLCACLAVPGMLLLMRVAPWSARDDISPGALEATAARLAIPDLEEEP